MTPLPHPFPFDPTYGYSLETLLAVEPPSAPSDFPSFWQSRFGRSLEIEPRPKLLERACEVPGMQLFELHYRSTDHFDIGGWLRAPQDGPVTRGLVVGHGYGGRDGPDLDLPKTLALEGMALLFPCFRGLSRSARPPISSDPRYHVLHHVDDRERYILGGCVEDLWLGVSSLMALFPDATGHLGYLGNSFGGGIGALALSVDSRVQRAHLGVPTFGHQPLRLSLSTQGSGEALRRYGQQHGDLLETLRYFDAASAAARIRVPVQVAAALFDPVVAPPGQFAVYNALSEPKNLLVLEAGHFDFPGLAEQERTLNLALRAFFEGL